MRWLAAAWLLALPVAAQAPGDLPAAEPPVLPPAMEQVENTARSLEARICRIPGADRHLPLRQYGAPVNPADIKKNLTLRSLISKNDPSLSSYLGLQDGSHRRREEGKQARIMQAERLQMLTEATRQQNQAARQQRENAALHGYNINTNRRWGQ